MKLRTAIFLLVSGACVKSFALPPVIDNSAYPPNAAPNMPATAAPSGTAVFELMGRMEQMQADIQQLTGKVEEQANQIAELKKKQSAMYGDFDDRLQGLEVKKEPAVPTELTHTDAAQIPAPLSNSNPGPIDSPANLAAATQGATASQPAAASPSAPPAARVPETEKQEYQNAYTLLRTNRTQESITAFNAYLQQHPNGGYASNAQYSLGEAYRVNKDNGSARQAFADVMEKYPNTAKVPDAMLMLGIIEAEQKNTAKSQEYFNRVVNEFPNTPAARKAANRLAQQDTPKN